MEATENQTNLDSRATTTSNMHSRHDAKTYFAAPPRSWLNPLDPARNSAPARLSHQPTACCPFSAYVPTQPVISFIFHSSSDNVNLPSVSASFADGLLSHLSVTLHEAPDIFLHAALACSERFARLLFHHPLIEGDERGKDAPSAAVAVGQTGECYNHSAKAVVALRGMESGVLDRGFGNRQVVFALTLGLGLVTFDLMDSGQGAHEICRFTLGLVERGYNKCSGGGDKGEGWVYRTGRVPEVDPGMVPLVFMDLVNCVVKGQIPVCRLEVGIEARGRVDQYIGVCGELLAPLFDLCRLSHELSHELSTLRCWRKSPLDGSSAILEELEYIEDTISEWQPQPSHNFGRALTSEEIYMVNTQARVFRDTVLLLTHRLRYGFGKHNDATRTLTDAIFTGIDTLTRGTVPSTSQDDDNPRFDYRMTFPFFVAAIGIQHPAERTTAREKLSRVVCGTLYPKVSEQLGQALTSVWDAQDSGNCTRWSDLVSPAVLPPVLF